MRPSLLYRIASVVIALFAVEHTIGFRQSDPRWGVDRLRASMESNNFDTQGFNRSYWHFFTGFGFFVSIFLIFGAVLAWQLGGVSAAELGRLRAMRWALAVCFVGITVLSWRYFFLMPVVFSVVISVLLAAAAWLPLRETVGFEPWEAAL